MKIIDRALQYQSFRGFGLRFPMFSINPAAFITYSKLILRKIGDDENCGPGEDQCTCASDCGTPPATETNCSDGIDEDCDTATDCDDSDCLDDPACPYCGNGTCDPDEDQCVCAADCGTPQLTETSCTDGDDNDCDTATDCDDSDCSSDPDCNCKTKGEWCSNNAECCSNDCRGKKCK